MQKTQKAATTILMSDNRCRFLLRIQFQETTDYTFSVVIAL